MNKSCSKIWLHHKCECTATEWKWKRKERRQVKLSDTKLLVSLCVYAVAGHLLSANNGARRHATACISKRSPSQSQEDPAQNLHACHLTGLCRRSECRLRHFVCSQRQLGKNMCCWTHCATVCRQTFSLSLLLYCILREMCALFFPPTRHSTFRCLHERALSLFGNSLYDCATASTALYYRIRRTDYHFVYSAQCTMLNHEIMLIEMNLSVILTCSRSMLSNWIDVQFLFVWKMINSHSCRVFVYFLWKVETIWNSETKRSYFLCAIYFTDVNVFAHARTAETFSCIS